MPTLQMPGWSNTGPLLVVSYSLSRKSPRTTRHPGHGADGRPPAGRVEKVDLKKSGLEKKPLLMLGHHHRVGRMKKLRPPPATATDRPATSGLPRLPHRRGRLTSRRSRRHRHSAKVADTPGCSVPVGGGSGARATQASGRRTWKWKKRVRRCRDAGNCVAAPDMQDGPRR